METLKIIHKKRTGANYGIYGFFVSAAAMVIAMPLLINFLEQFERIQNEFMLAVLLYLGGIFLPVMVYFFNKQPYTTEEITCDAQGLTISSTDHDGFELDPPRLYPWVELEQYIMPNKLLTRGELIFTIKWQAGETLYFSYPQARLLTLYLEKYFPGKKWRFLGAPGL